MKRFKKKTCLIIILIILLCLNLFNSFQKILDRDEFSNIRKFYKYEHNVVNLTMKQIEPNTLARSISNSNTIEKVTLSKMVTTLVSSKKTEKYLFQIDEKRINRLFKILHHKESIYEKFLDSLDLISFEKLILNFKTDNKTKTFSNEINKYLKVINKEVVVTDDFVNYLRNLSDYHSFVKPRNNIKKAKITDETKKPVLVTAANSDYYQALQATVHYIQMHFTSHKLIIYDLGLYQEQLDLTIKNCKCIVKKFDKNRTYSSAFSFIKILKKFSWKPLIIQEALKEYQNVLYVDSSIRFKSGEINPLVETCQNVGMLTQFIGFKLVCYTNMNQFVWFGEDWKSYKEFFTIEANILMFHRSFLTNLIMKTWVTCALDESCIAPIETQPVQSCYNSHRYDQDALTIVNSFFYGHPTKKFEFLPAYSFTTNESYFFEIKRYEGFNIWG